jgi:hypothetical protein
MVSCPSALLFTILTIFSIGITTVAVITAYVWLRVNHIESLSTGMNIGLICAMVVSVLLLIFSIYASWCGEYCARGLLGLCFLIYTLGFVGIACEVAWDHDTMYWIIDQANRFWKEPDLYPNIAHKIEERMNCQCWNNETCLPGEDVETESCETKMKREYDQDRFIIAGAIGGGAVVMLIGAICAAVSACEEKKRTSYLKLISSTGLDVNTMAWSNNQKY